MRGFLVIPLIFLISTPANAENNSGGYDDDAFQYGHGGKFIFQPSIGVEYITRPYFDVVVGYGVTDTFQLSLEAGIILPLPSDVKVGKDRYLEQEFGSERKITNSLNAYYVIRPEYQLKMLIGGGAGIAIDRRWSEEALRATWEKLEYVDKVLPLVYASTILMYDFTTMISLFFEVRGGIAGTKIYFPMLVGTQMRF